MLTTTSVTTTSQSIALVASQNQTNDSNASGFDVQLTNTLPRKDDKKALTVEREVRAAVKDVPELVEIARCESHYRQADENGNVFRGVVNKADVGVFQINEKYHMDKARSLGYDIYTLKGNIAYAKYLYKREGITPWASSSPCWAEKVATMRGPEALASASNNLN